MSSFPPVSVRLVLALAVLAVGAQAQGRLELLNARGEVSTLAPVTILAETLDEIRYERGGRSESRKTADLVAIDYGPGSAAYEQARQLLQQGQDLANVANLFAAASNDTEPAWVAAHALLGQAEALARRGAEHVGEALAALQQFESRFPDHRLLPEALLDRARYAASAGDLPAATAAVTKVLELASAGRLGADWAPRAHLEHGRMLLDADQARAAGEAFAAAERAAADARRAVEGRADRTAEVERLLLSARGGVGAAMLAGGDVGGARAYFERLLRDAGADPAVTAAATCGLAECDFQAGQLKQAQLGFARVAVTAVAVPDEHARSLYFLGRCSDELAAAGKERNGKARAREYYQDVVQRYPGTAWARAAQKSLP